MSMTDLAARGLRPVQELARGRDHGDRLRYMAGCRCDACRAANTGYERERAKARKAGDWNGIVPADRARAHLAKLSRAGVGRRAVCAATDIAETVLQEIRKGQRTRIRARTERRILAVSTRCRSDRALIGAGATWQLVKQLLDEGYTRARIAQEMGFQRPALQLGKHRITVRNAARLERVFHKLMD